MKCIKWKCRQKILENSESSHRSRIISPLTKWGKSRLNLPNEIPVIFLVIPSTILKHCNNLTIRIILDNIWRRSIYSRNIFQKIKRVTQVSIKGGVPSATALYTKSLFSKYMYVLRHISETIWSRMFESCSHNLNYLVMNDFEISPI